MADFIRPRGVIDAGAPIEKLLRALTEHGRDPQPVGEGTARQRAALRGWSIDPALTPGNPHALNACNCRQRRLATEESGGCACTCHGRTFIHYKRGA